MQYNTKHQIPGWFDFSRFYDAMIARMPDQSQIVEIGTLFGASAAHLVDGLETAGKSSYVHLVDVFDVDEVERSADSNRIAALYGGFRNAFNHYSQLSNLEGRDKIRVTVHSDDSVVTSHLFDNESLDWVFLDGSHKYEKVKAEIQNYLPKMKSGGYLSGHDITVSRFGVRRAVEGLLPVDQIEISDDGCWLYQVV